MKFILYLEKPPWLNQYAPQCAEQQGHISGLVDEEACLSNICYIV
jgi:hypothetical protein